MKLDGTLYYAEGGEYHTLTRECILSLRPAATKLDRCTRQHIVSLGCAGRRRGCRGGRPKTKLSAEIQIPVIVGRRCSTYSGSSSCIPRQRTLVTVKTQPILIRQAFASPKSFAALNSNPRIGNNCPPSQYVLTQPLWRNHTQLISWRRIYLVTRETLQR